MPPACRVEESRFLALLLRALGVSSKRETPPGEPAASTTLSWITTVAANVTLPQASRGHQRSFYTASAVGGIGEREKARFGCLWVGIERTTHGNT
jgi:hypothetical protein